MVSFFAEVKIFRFWPKTMDYNKAFCPKSSSFSAVFLLLTGRCYGAEFCTILLLLRCSFRWYPFFAEVKIFRFWPKTMDYNKAFCPKSSSFSAVFLLLTGRCYGAEFCTILLLLRCSFRWYPFFAEVKFFRFWPKTMDYNKAFCPQSSSFSAVFLLLTGRCYGVEICVILLLLRCSFHCIPFLPKSKFSDIGRKPWTIVHGLSL